MARRRKATRPKVYHRNRRPILRRLWWRRRENMASLGLMDADLNRWGHSGSTPLMRAVMVRNVPLARALLARGADPNAADAEGWTALHCAIVGRPLRAVVRLLIARGADVDAEDAWGQKRALFEAVVGRQRDLAQFLLRKGADPAAGFRPAWMLGYAVGWGCPEVVIALVDAGMAVDTQLDDGETALHHASCGNLSLARALLARGAHVDARDALGATPLMYAVMREQADIVRLLVSLGADVTARDNQDRGVVEWTHEDGRSDLLALLRAFGQQE